MSDIVNFNKNLILHVNNPKDHDMICKVSRALASPERVRILKSLLNHPKYLSDLSKELDIPVSSVSRHIDVLAEAQLVFIDYQPGLKGHKILYTARHRIYNLFICPEFGNRAGKGIYGRNARRYVFALSHKTALRYGG